MCLCCGTKVCMICTCLILIVLAIGFLFGFGVFTDGFHKLKQSLHYCHPTINGTLAASFGTATGRPFVSLSAPSPL
ncbi:uncharacterized protein LOC124940680 [Impatiens glandulifera]|uniref:uncharacterized protein LOC124940680 n=1 Tax=Impatiens glandulifera TaxID=253017 RepID=UPI001FB0B907|nr:uncharacterized protein LOC124940680 [Impatiens glandulifera]